MRCPTPGFRIRMGSPWRPRRPRSFSRVTNDGAQLRQSEFQQSALRVAMSTEPACLRDFEIASSAHDVMSAHHDRGFGDLDLFSIATFKEPMMPWVVSELNHNAHLRIVAIWSFQTQPILPLTRSWYSGCGETIKAIAALRRDHPRCLEKMASAGRYGGVQRMGWLGVIVGHRFYSGPNGIGAVCNAFTEYSRTCKWIRPLFGRSRKLVGAAESTFPLYCAVATEHWGIAEGIPRGNGIWKIVYGTWIAIAISGDVFGVWVPPRL